ncbi:MAG: four helix bundle protein [Bacteroidetes bacterium]|nr:MAG: four helix bundle protein [Bacteroidota bacterium]
MKTIEKFEDFEVWQLAREFCKNIDSIAKETALKNDFKLRGQIEGSSGSIMDNIAEGFERGGNKEFIQFLSFSKGSAGESRSQLYRCLDKGYINENQFEDLKIDCLRISSKLNNLMSYLNKSTYKGSKFKDR